MIFDNCVLWVSLTYKIFKKTVNLVLKNNKITLTLSRATQVHVFLLTNAPSRALPLMIQYGTPILRHKAGKNKTN